MEAKMFAPTKNLFQVWHRPDEREAFEREASEQAQMGFVCELKIDGFNSMEEFKSYLRTFSEADLSHDVFEMTEEAEDERIRAGHPDITPEQSFNRLVASLEIEESIKVHKEVIAEMQ